MVLQVDVLSSNGWISSLGTSRGPRPGPLFSYDETWLWHARFGHLNFRALRDLGRKGMVEGMPLVDHVEQVFDGCTLEKQHRKPFPQSSNFRASCGLELVHADLYGQINPPTPGEKSYFLLVFDDYSKWVYVGGAIKDKR